MSVDGFSLFKDDDSDHLSQLSFDEVKSHGNDDLGDYHLHDNADKTLDSRSFLTKIKSDWYYKNIDIEFVDTNDVLITKLAIKQAKKDLKEILRKINEIETFNSNSVSKREYDDLNKKYFQMSNDLKSIKKEIIEKYDQFRELEREQCYLIKERDRLFYDNKKLKETMTPRPNWAKCENYYSGGARKWHQLMKTLRSNELVDVLLNEFIGGNDGTNKKHEILVNESDIRSHILPSNIKSSEKKQPNMKLAKRDVLILMKEIMFEKTNYDFKRNSKGIDSEKLKHFIYIYFRKKYQVTNSALRWYTNLIDSIDRFSHDENIKLFKGILNEQIDENIYQSFVKLVCKMHDTCKNYAIGIQGSKSEADYISVNGSVNVSRRNSTSSVIMDRIEFKKLPGSGITESNVNNSALNLRKKDFISVLKSIFTKLGDNEIKSFLNAVKNDFIDLSRRYENNNEDVTLDDYYFEKFDFNYIFQINDDCTHGAFLSALKLYMKELRNNYVFDILNEIIKIKNLNPSLNSIKFSGGISSANNSLIVDKSNILKQTRKKIFKTKKSSKRKLKKITMKKKTAKFTNPKISENNNLKVLKSSLDIKHTSSISNSESSIVSYDIEILEPAIYNSAITIDELSECIKKVDPSITKSEIERYNNWVFKAKMNINDEIKALEIGKIIKRLQNLNCFMHEKHVEKFSEDHLNVEGYIVQSGKLENKENFEIKISYVE